MWASQRPALDFKCPSLLRRAGRRAAVLNLDMVLIKPVPSIHHLWCIISQEHIVYTVPTVAELMTNSLMSLYFWRRLIFLLLWVNTANMTSRNTTEAANDSVNYSDSASNKLARQSCFAILCDLRRWASERCERCSIPGEGRESTAVFALHQPGETWELSPRMHQVP